MQNRVFFPQAALDRWIVDGSVDLQKGELTIRGVGGGRRYVLDEAVRVLREVSGGADRAKLIGRVRTRVALEGQGAEIVETSMLLGDTAYDVEPGWVGTPVGRFASHIGQAKKGKGGAAPKSDEDLLARFVASGK